MKLLSIIFSFISVIAFAQNEVVDLEINGKDLTSFTFNNNHLVLKSSKGGGPYSKEKDIELKVVNLDKKEVLHTYKSEKDIDFSFYANGYFKVRGTAALIGYGTAKKPTLFFNEKGEFIRELEDFYKKEIKFVETSSASFVSQNYFFEIGPKDKGYKKNKKQKAEDDIEWYLSRIDLNTSEEKLFKLNLDGLTGRNSSIGYSTIYYTDKEIYLLSKEFSNTNDGKYNDVQNIIITILDFEGNILRKDILNITIDNQKHHFVKAGLIGGYITRLRDGISYRIPQTQATGKVYIDFKNEFYYVIYVLGGNKKNEGAWIHAKKFTFDGKEIWESNKMFMEDTPSRKITKYISCDPVITDDRLFFMESNETSKKSFKNLLAFSMDANTGEILNERDFEKADGIFKRGATWYTILTGKTLKKELSKDIVLSDFALMSYALNDKLKAYLSSLTLEEETFFYSHILDNGDLYLLQANYKDQDYKLLLFKNE